MGDNQTPTTTTDLISDSTSEIKDCLLTYGEDILRTKFPHYIDGLKDVSRRILWFTREQRETRSFIRVMGDIVENHVAGDTSVYGAIIRLGQPFMVGHPLVHIEGKYGSYHSPHDSAAPRYLNMAISEFSRDLFFNGIHPKTIPMVPTKNFETMEPKYLIPKLPTALLLGNLTVGFGFKSTTPMIDFEDVCNLVMMYAEYYQQYTSGMPKYGQLANLLVPTFPINNIIRNRKDLIAAYRKGEYDHEILMEGRVDITGNSITLRAVPYGVDFGTVTQDLRETMKNKKHWLWDYIVSANQFSSSEAEFTMEIKRGLNPFEILDKLKPTLKFTKKWTPIFSYMKDGRAVTLHPQVLTALWYNERFISIAGGLKYRQSEIVTKRMTAEAILQISEHTDQVIDIIKNSENDDDAVTALYRTFKKLTWKQARIIVQQRLSTLAKAKKQQIEQEIEQLDEDMKVVLSKFNHIHESIYQDAQFLKNKYKSTKQTRFSEEYIGAVQFGTQGVTNFFDTDNMIELLNSRGWNCPKQVYRFNSSTVRGYIQNNRLVYPEHYLRDVHCQKIIIGQATNKSKMLLIEKDKPAILITSDAFKYPNDFTYTWVEPEFIGVYRDGSIRPTTWKDVNTALTNKNSKVSKQSLIYGYNRDITKPVIIHMNAHNPNVLRIDVVDDKFSTVPIGTEVILAVVEMGTKELFCNIPVYCTKNNNLNFLTIRNLHKLGNKKQYIVNLSRTAKGGGGLRRDKDVRSWFILDAAAL